jgi:hypothetical protein
MRNLIAKALPLVLLWTFIGPAALVAASNQDAHECCHRAHHPTTHNSQFEAPNPSHECCRLLFASHAPTLVARPMPFGDCAKVSSTPDLVRNNYCGQRFGSHPERAPPYSTSSL